MLTTAAYDTTGSRITTSRPGTPANERVGEHQDVDHRVEAHTRDPGQLTRQSQRHAAQCRSPPRRRPTGASAATAAPAQARPPRSSRTAAPGRRRPGRTPSSSAVTINAPTSTLSRDTRSGTAGCSALDPQRAQGVGDHTPSLGIAKALGTDRKNETRSSSPAEEGPASTPMCARCDAARVLT